jgi:Ala-tRNA(Pro) deacylase
LDTGAGHAEQVFPQRTAQDARRGLKTLSMLAAEMSAAESVYDRVVHALQHAAVSFREVQHEPTLTSADSARARGEPLGVGAKALLLKCDGAFRLIVLPADRKLGSKRLKQALGVKDVRFASREELFELTGLVPGSVPPFGEPILPFPLFADHEVGVRFPRVAFNAGDLCRSIVMSAGDWEAIARPQRIACAEADPAAPQ